MCIILKLQLRELRTTQGSDENKKSGMKKVETEI
jgi:hypothetical protein